MENQPPRPLQNPQLYPQQLSQGNTNVKGTPQVAVPQYQVPTSKKRIVLIIGGVLLVLSLIILLLVLILNRGSSDEPKEATLTYWGLWEDASVFSEVIREFEKQNPTIKVKYEKQDIRVVGKYMDRLFARINKGDGPDLYRFHSSWVPQLVGKKLVLPLPSSVIQATEFDTQYYEVVKKDMQVDGAFFGIPLGVDSLALFVNLEIFEAAGVEVPTTWEDLEKVARQLTVVDEQTSQIDTAGVALGTYDNISHASDIISLLLIQNGSDLKNLAGDKKINTEQALQFYTNFASGETPVWNNQMDNSKLAFTKGKLAMYFGYSWDILEISGANPELKFQITSVPHLPGRNETIASYWVEGVSSKTRFPNEAFVFLQFLASKPSLEKMFTAQSTTRGIGVSYPRRDMAELLKDNKLLYPFVAQMPTAVSTIFASDTYDAGSITALNGYLANAINSVFTNGTSIATAVETLANGVATIIKK